MLRMCIRLFNPIPYGGGAIWPPLGYIAGKLKIDPGRRPGLLGLLILFSFGCFWRFLWNFHVPVRIYAGFVRPG